MNLLSDAHLERIEAHLVHVLNRSFSAAGVGRLNEMIRAYVRSGGKRIRPQLCVWTYRQGAAAEADSSFGEDPLLDLACGWELFHAFLLVHDDIIDNSDTRRGEPSLHRRLAELDGNAHSFGANLGIVAGDLLFSAAMRVWHELELPAEMYRDQLKLFSRIATITGFGQAIDICQSHADLNSMDEQLLLREYHWKTAAYTFEGPMLSGAMLAGVDEPGLRAISRFALSLGQAYQLQNDLLDLSQPTHEGSDLVQGKRTIGLLRARAGMPAAQRAEFDRRLYALSTANGEAVELAELLRNELRDCGAIEKTEQLVREFLDNAQDAAGDRAMPVRLAAGLTGLLQALQAQYFSPVAEPSP